MITLEDLEQKHNYTFSPLYKKLFEAGMLNWMRGFNEPLEEGKTWAKDVYPTLQENPPLFLHSGGFDLELMTPKQILEFEFPDTWNQEKYQLIPFAKTSEKHLYAFYKNVEIEGENPIVFIWHEDETEIVAKNFEEFIFRTMLSASDDIDKENLEADYGKESAMEKYRDDLMLDLKSMAPFLKKEHHKILNEAYEGEVIETLISYSLKCALPLKEIVNDLSFDELGDTFDHEA